MIPWTGGKQLGYILLIEMLRIAEDNFSYTSIRDIFFIFFNFPFAIWGKEKGVRSTYSKLDRAPCRPTYITCVISIRFPFLGIKYTKLQSYLWIFGLTLIFANLVKNRHFHYGTPLYPAKSNINFEIS